MFERGVIFISYSTTLQPKVTEFPVGKIDTVATFIGKLPNFVGTFGTRFASTKIVKPKLQNHPTSLES